jgi:Tol biopolymer transport system component
MTGRSIVSDLEAFTLLKDGKKLSPIDRNYWGVTFMPTNSDRFYATAGTAGSTYLVDGRISDRTLTVMRDNVECPSLSPDGSRLVFKKRFTGPLGQVTWRLHLLDLATMSERALAETHSVDDQVEWLDTHRVLYSLPDQGPPATIRPDLWSLDVDSGGPPVLLRAEAMSPSVVR